MKKLEPFAPVDRWNYDESMFIHNSLGTFSLIPKNTNGRTLANEKESMTIGCYLNQIGDVAWRPMLCSKSLPRCKRSKKMFKSEYIHERPNKSAKTVEITYEIHKDFCIYRTRAGWNERGVMVKELQLLNEEMKKNNRKIALCIDHAPCHLIGKQFFPDLSNITLLYIGRGMTASLQENLLNFFCLFIISCYFGNLFYYY